MHVHAHYQLIAGDDLTKNYRLPLERSFLEGAQPAGELRVPPVELELILLVLRLTIKHGTWDAVAMHRGGVPDGARAELAWLEERADEALVREHLARELPSVGFALFARCRASLEPGARTPAGLRAGSEMLRALRPYGRRSRAADLSLMTVRRADAVAARLTRRRAPRKRLVAGGAVIALVGADGAGKSTAIEALDGWLGRTFPVTRVHLGRPPLSPARKVLTNAARGRSLGRKLLGRRPPALATEHAVLAAALARDRFLTFRRARRIATNGGLVISDRFPLPQLPTMDAPRVERFRHPTHLRRFTDALSALERRYYEVITGPDVLIVLRVDPEVAVARKPEEPPEFIRLRWGEIWAVDWAQVPGAHVVDAGAPVEDVHAQIKALIWAQI